MSAEPSYKPPGISAANDLTIKLLFAGVHIALALYGVAAVLFVQCVKAILPMLRTPGGNTFSKRLQLLHVILIFICGGLFIIGDTWLITVSSLDNPLFKGGPQGWISAHYNHPMGIMGNVAFELTAWLADGFMLFRCYIVFAQTTGIVTWAILLLPSLLYLASLATGILLLVQVSLPRSTLWTNVNFGLANFSIIATLNILITLLISGRLIMHRIKMGKLMGRGSDRNSFKMYTSISTILVESSAMYTAVFLMFIVPYVMKSAPARFFLPLLAMVQVISPLLVSLRLAKQIAWTRTTTTQVSEGGMKFKSAHLGTGASSTTAYGSKSEQQVAVSISLETRKDYTSDDKV